jgi:hypothetical protein
MANKQSFTPEESGGGSEPSLAPVPKGEKSDLGQMPCRWPQCHQSGLIAVVAFSRDRTPLDA